MNRDPALEEAILDSELRYLNFFNGRLLTGGDLESEQAAQRAHTRHLGSALGAGIAHGLEVALAAGSTATQPVVSVSAGLALNAVGQTLRLECNQRVALVLPPDPAVGDACVFKDCGPATPGASLASGLGYYVLTIAPASRPEGKTAVSGLGTAPALCNHARFVDGVRFRLIAIPGLDATFALPPRGSAERNDVAAFARLVQRIRHRLAWRFLGIGANLFSHYLGDPLSLEIESYGEFDASAPEHARRTEVPLALLGWLEEGLQFLDPWAVRRRLVHGETAPRFAPLLGARRLVEAEAAFYQFQDQLDSLAGPQARQFQARDLFEMLPGGGFLPTGADGFDPAHFFAGISFERVTDDPAWLRALVRTSLDLEPIIVPPPGGIGPVHVKVFSFGDSPFVFFLRAAEPAPVVQPPAPPTPPPAREKGSILATVQLANRIGVNTRVRVVAENARGESFEEPRSDASVLETYLGGNLRFLTKTSRITTKQANSGATAINVNEAALSVLQPVAAGRFVFLIPDLEAGSYAVKASAPFHKTKSVKLSVAPGERAQVSFLLEFAIVLPPDVKDPPVVFNPKPWPEWPPRGPFDPRPPRELIENPPWLDPMPSRPILFDDPIRDALGRPYRKAVITPEVEIGPKVAEIEAGWTRLSPESLPAATRAQLDAALTEMATTQPTAPVTTEGWTLFIDPAHDPAAPGAAPYSYLKMGHGPALATVLVPEASALPAEFPATRAGVPEVTSEAFASRLAETPFAAMDVLGAAWGGARATLLGMPVENAVATGRTLLAAAGEAKKDFTYVPGITAGDGAALKAKGLDATTLANASAVDFATAGDAADLARWTRIIAQFQTYVPRETYQLETSGLALTATERGLLAENRLDSIGALARGLEGDAALVTKLGWSAEKLAVVKQQLGEKLGVAHARLGAERGLDTVLAGQGTNAAPLAEKMVAFGIDSMTKLASSDPVIIAKEFGIAEAAAGKIVQDAMVATLTDKTGLSQDAAEKLVTKTKATSLADFERVTPERMNTILQNKTDAARITGALHTVRIGAIR